MKTIKTYENFMDFDPNFAIAKIKHFFSEYDVKSMVDDEIKNWVEEDQIGDSYEDAIDWYYDNGSGEAEEVVVDELINWYETEFKKELTDEQREELSNTIIKEYDFLNSNNY
jgi:hypothetical protein